MGLIKTAISIAVVAWIVRLLNDFGVFTIVFNHAPGKCTLIKGIETGAEDVIILQKTGLALITSGIWNPSSNSGIGPPGQVYLFDPRQPEKPAELLLIPKFDGLEDFHPSGIAAYENSDRLTVFCVNSKLHQVLKFKLNIQKRTLAHVKTISGPKIHMLDTKNRPNNLAVVSEDEFYVSNLFGFTHPVAVLVAEIIGKIPLGSITHYRRGILVETEIGLSGPNGLVISKDGRFLFAALVFEKALAVYRILPDKDLALVTKVPLNTGVDNLNLDGDGSIYVGCHPAVLALQIHLNSLTTPAPSQVLKISFSNDDSFLRYSVEEVYSNNGTFLSGIAVAAPTTSGTQMIIGSIATTAALCDL